jgi:hypothetical protein
LTQQMSVLIPLVLLSLWTSPSLRAQRILYDSARDKTAQDAQTTAGQMTAGALFDKMVANVATQANASTKAQVDQESEASRAVWNSIERWRWDNRKPYANGIQNQEFSASDSATAALAGTPPNPNFKTDTCLAFASSLPTVCHSVRCLVEDLQQRLNLDTSTSLAAVNDQLLQIKKTEKDLAAALKDLKAAAKTPDVQALVDKKLGDVQDAVKLADSLANGVAKGSPVAGALDATSKALSSIQKSLDQILQLYGIVKAIWAGEDAVKVDPTSLRPPREKTDLALLAMDEAHFKRLGMLRARTQLLVKATNQHLQSVKTHLIDLKLWDSDLRIEETLRSLQQPADSNRDNLEEVIKVLHLTAAAMSSGQAIVDLGCNMESFENRTWQLQRASVESQVYDATLQAAAQRLAAYWKVGIKPDQLAQLVFNLTSAVTLPVIANK